MSEYDKYNIDMAKQFLDVGQYKNVSVCLDMIEDSNDVDHYRDDFESFVMGMGYSIQRNKHGLYSHHNLKNMWKMWKQAIDLMREEGKS